MATKHVVTCNKERRKKMRRIKKKKKGQEGKQGAGLGKEVALKIT